MHATYITTDLELRARFDFTLLHDELQKLGFYGYPLEARNGSWRCGYGGHCKATPSKAIESMLDALSTLSPQAKEQWEACRVRRFNIGFEHSSAPFYWSHSAWQIEPSVLMRMAEAQGFLQITIYRTEMNEHEPEKRG